MIKRSAGFSLLRAILLSIGLCAVAAPATAACMIPESPCYPWHIQEGDDETILLEIIPNNVETGAIYRICVCPPAADVAVVFDFRENARTLGTISSRADAPVCRDYRFQTARQSALKVRRAEGGKGPVEGCYLTTY